MRVRLRVRRGEGIVRNENKDEWIRWRCFQWSGATSSPNCEDSIRVFWWEMHTKTRQMNRFVFRIPYYSVTNTYSSLFSYCVLLRRQDMLCIAVYSSIVTFHSYVSVLSAGIILFSSGASFFFVAKKAKSFCPCINYLGLNDITVKNHYPLPPISSAFYLLQRACIFTKLDLCNAYHLVRIHGGGWEEDCVQHHLDIMNIWLCLLV